MSNTIKLRALRPLASGDYRLLFAAVGIEVFGTGMWTIVMVFQVLALDDSPLALSAVATGMSLGLFSFSVLGGVVADRFSKRRILITVQGSTAAIMTAVAVLSLTGNIELWHVAAASFAMGAGSAFFYPAYSAYLPVVLPPEQLLAANGRSVHRWGKGWARPSVESSSVCSSPLSERSSSRLRTRLLSSSPCFLAAVTNTLSPLLPRIARASGVTFVRGLPTWLVHAGCFGR